jgi:ABC-type sugar transport system ATPase subunit
LEVAGLSLQRGAPTLGPVSFVLPHPGVWWLTGASGAGKSLLLEALAGFHADARGGVRVAGREVAELAPERRSIALMPQRWRLFPHWTVARNLRFAAKLADADSIDRTARINPLAERLQVADLLRRATRGLSGGETQRLALIQTLLSPARVLLFDEPLSAIDAPLQAAALDLLQEISAKDGRICLIAAHRAATSYPMRGALLLENGKLVSITNSG